MGGGTSTDILKGHIGLQSASALILSDHIGKSSEKHREPTAGLGMAMLELMSVLRCTQGWLQSPVPRDSSFWI